MRVLPLTQAYPFGIENGLEAEMIEIRNMEIEWDRSYTSTLRRGFIIAAFEKADIFERFKELFWQDGNTLKGEAYTRRCLRIKSEYENFLAGNSLEEVTETISDEENFNQKFALEAHLRDFLAKNLERIEPGLQLYEKDGRSGVEFKIDEGRIDILALDSNNKFLVIELKLSYGRNKTIGQLLYYMGWVDKNLGNPPCRGMIVANEISEGLLIAVQRVPGVSVYRYNLSVSVERVLN